MSSLLLYIKYIRNSLATGINSGLKDTSLKSSFLLTDWLLDNTSSSTAVLSLEVEVSVKNYK